MEIVNTVATFGILAGTPLFFVGATRGSKRMIRAGGYTALFSAALPVLIYVSDPRNKPSPSEQIITAEEQYKSLYRNSQKDCLDNGGVVTPQAQSFLGITYTDFICKVEGQYFTTTSVTNSQIDAAHERWMKMISDQ